MSLSEALKEEAHKPRVRRCLVCDWLLELPEADRKSFNDWLDQGRAIAPLLRAAKKQNPPVPVQRNAFERHCHECADA